MLQGHHPRRRILPTLVRSVVVLAALCCLTTAALAQEPAPAAPASAVTRPLWFDGAITVVAIGLGLFVVVRNSNRN